MNKTPLKKILEWFQPIEKDIKIELLYLCDGFHYDESIRKEYDGEKKIENFVAFLNNDFLSAEEVITRSLFTIGLLDFAFCGRDTEEGWDKTMDRNLDVRNRLTARGFSGENLDKALEGWQSRKYFWIDLANSWYELKDNHLTTSDLSQWHLFNCRISS